MVKLDLKALREATGGKLMENGDESSRKEIDPLKLQKMKLEEAQWRALGGGGNDDNDPLDKLAEKMYHDLRREQFLKSLRGLDENENSTIKRLERELEEMKRKYEEAERKRIEEEKERKMEERFERLEKMILESKNGNGKDEDAVAIALKEIEKMREEDRKERERMRKEEEKERERQNQIDALREEMSEHQSRLENMIRDGVGKRDKGFLAELKEFRDTEDALNKLLGKRGGGEDEGLNVGDVLDEITDKGPKVAQAVRSIYDLAKGEKEEDIDIGPMETLKDEETIGKTPVPEEKNPIEKYVDEGYEIDDPDHPGKKMFVGLYKDYYVDQDGMPLSKAAVQLIAKTNPGMIERTVEQAREQYFKEQAEIMKKASERNVEAEPASTAPPPTEEKAPNPPQSADEKEESTAETETIEGDNEEQS